jgi:hypothetical protein
MTDNQKQSVVRIDFAESPIRMRRTDEGYLTGEARVARVGIQSYQDGAGGIRQEYRPVAEVFAADAMSSFKSTPVTMGHPAERIVDSTNAKRLSIGFVGESIRPDGEWVVMPITITDAESIAQIEAGTVQLSAGYMADVMDAPGEYGGMKYDAVQTNIRGNHVAVVKQARAGDQARLNLDAADAVAVTSTTQTKGDNRMSEKTVTVRVDGIEYQAAPEVERHISKQDEQIASLKADMDAVKAEAETAKAKADAAAEEMEAYKAKHNDESIREAAKARVALERAATKVVGDEADFDGKTDREIQESVVKAVHKDADMTDKSDVYVQARFDAAIEVHQAHIDASANQRKVAGVKADASKNEDPRQKAMEDMKNQYKRGKN